MNILPILLTVFVFLAIYLTARASEKNREGISIFCLLVLISIVVSLGIQLTMYVLKLIY